MASNPAPRAALSHEGDAVVRPALRRTSDVTPSPAVTSVSPPAPSPTDALVGVAAPASGDGHPKHKGKKHKAGKHETADTVELVVTLAKPVRRTLKTAAAERETTPEALASLVLTAWLER